MGLAFDVTTNYFFPEQEAHKIPALDNGDLSGDKIGFSIEPVDFSTTGMDDIFRQKSILRSGMERGYRPFTLGASTLRTAAANLNYRKIGINDLEVPITPEGHMLVPAELAPLQQQFQQAAGYFVGLADKKLTPSVRVLLSFRRDIVALPGYPPNALPHCDYLMYKTQDNEQPFQAIVLSTDFVGTVFYPDLSFLDINTWIGGGFKQWPHFDKTKPKFQNHISVPAGTWSLASGFHVHEAPPLKLNDVPIEEQFPWQKIDAETGKIKEEGMACIRNFAHMAFTYG